MKIVLYFGSFNPIHNGHLIIANHIVQNEEVNELWFVVSPQNPFKFEKKLLNANHRYQLIKLAIEGETKLRASNIEFKLPKPSYTVNTLIYLKEKHPNDEFVIAMGSDGFKNISKWKNANYILENYKILIYRRPGFEIDNKIGANFKILDSPQLYITSTYIRELIRKRKSIRYLLPDVVKDEIEANNYYNNILEKES